MKYRVMAIQSVYYELEVEADSPEEAEEIADAEDWGEAKRLPEMQWEQVEGSAEVVHAQ